MSDPAPPTLADWLLEQIAAQELRLDNMVLSPYVPDSPLVRLTLRTALGECEAKRRIVEQYRQVKAESAAARHTGMFEQVWALTAVLCALALPYADRPGYREEWRP